ncbi:helix-turn-helix domain-containing protein [Spirillospora sp. CA-128828]|uniref:helix-turn-helix domain-containing protein n=1 Tax=Spirillospora sp. CA-128828 TaxID=3240033 RepID=UPI003D8C31E1
MDARAEIGQRIARQRRRRGLSQVVVSGLVGRSESWLSQVARGRRSIDSHSVLVRLAEVLGMDYHQLTSDDVGGNMARYEGAAGIREAMLRYETLPATINGRGDLDGKPRLSWLAHEVRRANRTYQATRYDEAGRLLTRLIISAERACQTRNGDDRRSAYTLCALVYQSAAMTLNRVGEADLAWTAADRSLSAARMADRPLLAAVSAYRLGYILIRQKRAREAEDMAIRSRDALAGSRRRSSPLLLSVRGGLCLVAVTAAAARFDRAAVSEHLASALAVANELGSDRNDFWTAFGPTNVLIHEVSSAVAFGDAKLALKRSEPLAVDSLGPGLLGRRAQVFLDLARAYALQRKDAAAVNTLLRAERLSPELVRYHPRTNELLTELVRREHRASTPALRGLAQRAGVV